VRICGASRSGEDRRSGRSGVACRRISDYCASPLAERAVGSWTSTATIKGRSMASRKDGGEAMVGYNTARAGATHLARC